MPPPPELLNLDIIALYLKAPKFVDLLIFWSAVSSIILYSFQGVRHVSNHGLPALLHFREGAESKRYEKTIALSLGLLASFGLILSGVTLLNMIETGMFQRIIAFFIGLWAYQTTLNRQAQPNRIVALAIALFVALLTFAFMTRAGAIFTGWGKFGTDLIVIILIFAAFIGSFTGAPGRPPAGAGLGQAQSDLGSARQGSYDMLRDLDRLWGTTKKVGALGGRLLKGATSLAIAPVTLPLKLRRRRAAMKAATAAALSLISANASADDIKRELAKSYPADIVEVVVKNLPGVSAGADIPAPVGKDDLKDIDEFRAGIDVLMKDAAGLGKLYQEIPGMIDTVFGEFKKANEVNGRVVGNLQQFEADVKAELERLSRTPEGQALVGDAESIHDDIRKALDTIDVESKRLNGAIISRTSVISSDASAILALAGELRRRLQELDGLKKEIVARTAEVRRRGITEEDVEFYEGAEEKAKSVLAEIASAIEHHGGAPDVLLQALNGVAPVVTEYKKFVESAQGIVAELQKRWSALKAKEAPVAAEEEKKKKAEKAMLIDTKAVTDKLLALLEVVGEMYAIPAELSKTDIDNFHQIVKRGNKIIEELEEEREKIVALPSKTPGISKLEALMTAWFKQDSQIHDDFKKLERDFNSARGKSKEAANKDLGPGLGTFKNFGYDRKLEILGADVEKIAGEIAAELGGK